MIDGIGSMDHGRASALYLVKPHIYFSHSLVPSAPSCWKSGKNRTRRSVKYLGDISV